MAVLNSLNPTLLDFQGAKEGDGRKIATLVELLQEQNEILMDMTWLEGNLTDGHETTIRTGLPNAAFTKLYQGVQPSKSTRVQIKDTCGRLESLLNIDTRLLKRARNGNEFKLQETDGHLEAMNQELSRNIFYGNAATNSAGFTGLAPRFNDTSAENGYNIIKADASASGSDQTSVWLISWHPTTTHGIYPQGSPSGLIMTPRGEQRMTDANGGAYYADETQFEWNCGLTVRDWRYVVRVCNIDTSALTYDASAGADLIRSMSLAVSRIQSLNKGRYAFYCNRTVMEFLRQQEMEKTSNSMLSKSDLGGRPMLRFDGIKISRCDAILNTESVIS